MFFIPANLNPTFAFVFTNKMQSARNITESGIEFKIAKPSPQLSDFVESFWMLENPSDQEKEIVVLPDGRFDIFFLYSSNQPFHAILRGLDSEPGKTRIPPKTVMFAISFKLLAIEYLLNPGTPVPLNNAAFLPSGFWDVAIHDLDDFERFCNTISVKMLTLIKPNIDSRKQKLFELIYSSNGSLSVKALSENVFWSSRQINRYFNQHFGISLKAYCNILRFRASLPHIKEGKLFPEQNFTDQNHFIKEVKKFSGVIPKELSKNKNDLFLLLSTLPER